MADYDDYLKDEERWARELDDLGRIREAAEWERRLRELVASTGKARKTILHYRARLVRNAVKLRPDMSEADASAWVDSVIGLEPAN
jgi:hypothetical protein